VCEATAGHSLRVGDRRVGPAWLRTAKSCAGKLSSFDDTRGPSDASALPGGCLPVMFLLSTMSEA